MEHKNSEKLFAHPFARRAIYKRAHADPTLADWVMKNDPLYGKRAKLNRFENTLNDIIVGVSLPFASSMEFIVGNILILFEGDAPVKRSKFGSFYDNIVYNVADPFHRKRLLYDLSTVKK